MSVLTGQTRTFDRCFNNPSLAQPANPTSITGTLVINSIDNAAAVTITPKALTGNYKIAVTMPTLAIADFVQVRIAIVYGGITYYLIIWEDYAEGNMWNVLRSTLTAANTIGKGLNDFLNLYLGGSSGGGSGGTNWLQDLLALTFANTAIPNVGDTTGLVGSGSAGNLWLSLHTASPANGNQSTNETTYGGYLRIGVVRTTSGWTVTGITAGGNVVNAATDTFAVVASGSGTITHLGIGRDSSGAGELMYTLPLATPFAITLNNRPYFSAGTISVSLQ